MTNFFLAFELDLAVIPVLNKVDIAHADVDQVAMDLESVFDLDRTSMIPISAKTGLNVSRVLDEVVRRIPPPKPRPYGGFWCFDAAAGQHGNRINFVKNFGNEILKPNSRIKLLDSDEIVNVREVGRSLPELERDEQGVLPGQIGYFIASKSNQKMTGQVLTSQNTTRADVQEKGCMLIANKLLGYFWYSKNYYLYL